MFCRKIQTPHMQVVVTETLIISSHASFACELKLLHKKAKTKHKFHTKNVITSQVRNRPETSQVGILIITLDSLWTDLTNIQPVSQSISLKFTGGILRNVLLRNLHYGPRPPTPVKAIFQHTLEPWYNAPRYNAISDTILFFSWTSNDFSG